MRAPALPSEGWICGHLLPSEPGRDSWRWRGSAQSSDAASRPRWPRLEVNASSRGKRAQTSIGMAATASEAVLGGSIVAEGEGGGRLHLGEALHRLQGFSWSGAAAAHASRPRQLRLDCRRYAAGARSPWKSSAPATTSTTSSASAPIASSAGKATKLRRTVYSLAVRVYPDVATRREQIDERRGEEDEEERGERRPRVEADRRRRPHLGRERLEADRA
jgi:hypothetical protein